MPLKNYYELLEIASTASAEEVKRAFRQQIARYHPDKVQHLGKEFQAIAADRAAELTEAYRILSDAGGRAKYDAARAAEAPAAAPASGAATPADEQPTDTGAPSPSGGPAPKRAGTPDGQFVQERASRDELMRKATMGRFREALAQVAGDRYDESRVPGFDIACVPKAKLFARGKGPRLLGRFVSRVDGEAVAYAYMHAGNWKVPSGEEICVILMGSAMAPPRELAAAIAEQRRRPVRGGKVTLIPVDTRVWTAYMPTDAPEVAKNLLARLQTGA